jgi:hypothetical protein
MAVNAVIIRCLAFEEKSSISFFELLMYIIGFKLSSSHPSRTKLIIYYFSNFVKTYINFMTVVSFFWIFSKIGECGEPGAFIEFIV